MKTLTLPWDALVAVWVVAAGATSAQQVYFADLPGEGDAPFYDDHGVRLAGSNYLAQLYSGFGPDALMAVGQPVTFGTNGYFMDDKVGVYVTAPGGSSWVQVRAWEARGGPTFEQAALTGYWTGISTVLYLPWTGAICGGVPCVPAGLTGLEYPGSPIVVRQPQSQKVRSGKSARLSVIASCGVTLLYQWYQGSIGNTNTPLVGATNATCTTPPLATNTLFWVNAHNAFGSTNSDAAMVSVYPANAAALDLRLVSGQPEVTVEGAAGSTYRLEYAPAIPATNWILLTNLSLPASSFTIADPTATNSINRFYRAIIP